MPRLDTLQIKVRSVLCGLGAWCVLGGRGSTSAAACLLTRPQGPTELVPVAAQCTNMSPL